MADEVEFVVGSLPPLTVHFAPLSDLDSVPEVAGWYAWFYIPSSLEPDGFQLYRHANVNSVVSGVFNLTFEGRLKPTSGDPSALLDFKRPDDSLETLRSLFLAFAPPLYVGISNQLRRRLKTHRARLQEFISSAEAPPSPLTASTLEADTERESQFFGARIGAALRTLKISADDLHVKCVEAKKTAPLRDIERILNFALTPHYGRK